MDLKTLVKCLADNYAVNDQGLQLRTLALTLRELAEEVDQLENERVERKPPE